MTNTPAISVLMPAFNAGPYISEAISSVLSQTFTGFELIIINDGSTDDTVKIIGSFNDQRIRILHQENQGVAAALNTGLHHAFGRYIVRCDADDISCPDRFREQYDFITANPGYVYIGSSVDYVDQSGNHIFTYHPPGSTDDEIGRHIYTESNFIHASVLYSREAAINAGSYNSHAYILEDHLLWLNMRKHGKSFNILRPLVKVRFNPGSLTINGTQMGKRYAAIKRSAFNKGMITESEGRELIAIVKGKDAPRIRQLSYESLLGKKYLWNNHQPEKARNHLKKALHLDPRSIKNRTLLLLSYLPGSYIRIIYNCLSYLK